MSQQRRRFHAKKQRPAKNAKIRGKHRGYVCQVCFLSAMTENELSALIVDLCFKIHKQYGPGLFESVYEEIFSYEWSKNGIPFRRQCPIPLVHEKIRMEAGYRADLIINEKVLVELKSIEALADVHYKQVQTYLKLTGLKLGLLVNFNVPLIKNGIHRVVNKL